MEPTKEQIEAYRHMIADGMSMEDKIREELSKTCDKFAGHEDRMAGCLEYLQECAKEILNSENGDVPDEVCYHICRDYFNDEIWKKEDEEKAERKKKQAERAAQNTAKKKAAEERKKAAEAKKAEAARKKAEALAKKKAEAEAKKKAEEERKAAELKRMKEEAEREAKAADEAKKAEEAKKANVCPGQLDFLAAMGV